MTNLKEKVEYTKEMKHDIIIMVKNGNYVSGTWDEQTHAEKLGFEFVGTVTQLWNAMK